jgi:hypothetical protein
MYRRSHRRSAFIRIKLDRGADVHYALKNGIVELVIHVITACRHAMIGVDVRNLFMSFISLEYSKGGYSFFLRFFIYKYIKLIFSNFLKIIFITSKYLKTFK